MKKSFFLLFVVCAVIVSGVSALTITPPRYNETVSAGSTVSFDVSLVSDNPSEKVIETVKTTGDCSGWVVIQPGAPVPLPATFHVIGNIPDSATNGRTRCDISFAQPQSGQITMIIQMPITFNVSNGVNPTPTPTATFTTVPTTTIQTTIPTTTSTILPTTTRTPEQTPVPTHTHTGLPLDPAVILVSIIIAAFIIVVVYDYRRGFR
jgi:hypothetical protein